MKKSIQTKRIEQMEELFDESVAGIKEFEKSLRKFSAVQRKIDILEDYYFSKQWRKDYEDDEKGKIIGDLKRGVLSEDGIYNMIIDNDELINKLERFVKKNKNTYEEE